MRRLLLLSLFALFACGGPDELASDERPLFISTISRLPSLRVDGASIASPIEGFRFPPNTYLTVSVLRDGAQIYPDPWSWSFHFVFTDASGHFMTTVPTPSGTCGQTLTVRATVWASTDATTADTAGVCTPWF